MNTQDRRNAIRSSLAIAPRPKMDDEKIGLLQELIFEAKELGDDALLLQLLQACTAALAELHAERARAAQ